MSEITFKSMGTTINLRIGRVPDQRAKRMLASGRQFIEGYDAALTRFSPDSELSRLNANPDDQVELSWLMSELIGAAIWSAETSGGLVDPAVIGALEHHGYKNSRGGATPASLQLALEEAPTRRPASADPGKLWRELRHDRVNRRLARPAGLRLDSGGVGKGLAVDLLARNWSLTLGPDADFLINCGGDLRFGPGGNSFGEVAVEDPFEDRSLPLIVDGGAVATTSIRNRIWRGGDGPAHHIIDPGSGAPAWTGVVAVTALAPTAHVAETLTKIAFLRGPDEALDTLAAADGGIVFTDDGAATYVGPDSHAEPVLKAVA